MSQRRLSQHSIELSDVSTRHSSMTYHSNTPTSQGQGLLTQPPEYEPVHDASVNDDVDTPGSHKTPSNTPTKHRGRRFWRRVGKKGLIIIPFGSLLLLASIIFLQFLWLQARKAKDGKEPHKLWKTIVFREWITRTVTITAVLMRSVITAQAAVIASMVAAIVVEASVHISQLPILSIARAVNISPTTLATPIYTNARLTSRYFHSLLVITTCFLAIGGQFISTLLLSDFQITSIESLPISKMRRVGSDSVMGSDSDQNKPWTQAPQAFWRFAEVRVPNQKTPPNIIDTGATARAAIPWLDEKSRVDLSFYKGKAATWDARVICFSPMLEEVNLVVKNGSRKLDTETSLTTEEIIIQGSLAYDYTYSPLHRKEDISTDSINCTLVRDSPVVICAIYNDFIPDSLLVDNVESRDEEKATSFLVFKSIQRRFMSHTDLEAYSNITFSHGQSDHDWTIRRDGPWTTSLNSSGDQIFALSYCCTDPTIYYLDVAMNGTLEGSEPTIELLWPHELQEDDQKVTKGSQSGPLRRQLGATLENLTPQDRGILSLDISETDQDSLLPSLGALRSLAANPAYTFDGTPAWEMHDFHKRLLLDIIEETGNPALAIQSLATTLNHMGYYASSYSWSNNTSITYVTSKSMSIPVGRAGFMSVIAIVAAHLVILFVTSVLFIQRTKATLIGNPWQSIAQVVSDDTLPILTRLDGLEDRTDEEMPNVTGNIQRRQNGRTEFGEKQE
ncbi:hypothetical protein PG985_007615 [Apiospora marii]|uniref:uncharacterized protein n=1 Tax=Apiospora marii TaxID=335849 RepID=UPI0031323310